MISMIVDEISCFFLEPTNRSTKISLIWAEATFDCTPIKKYNPDNTSYMYYISNILSFADFSVCYFFCCEGDEEFLVQYLI